MEEGERAHCEAVPAARVLNEGGSSPYVVVCDHASNHVPRQFGSLGLTPADLERHIAWDPGALPVSEALAQSLDAVLVASTMSRLVIDPNRSLNAPDLIAAVSETTAVPGNADLSEAAAAERIALAYEPYHAALDAMIAARLAAGRETQLIAVHSFNPVYRGVSRPWHVGVIHDDDERLSAPLIAALQRHNELVVGVNEPYSPADRVYFTLERHARARGLPCVMIEVRNDEIADGAGQARWAAILAQAVAEAERPAGSTIGTQTPGRRGHIA